MRVVWISCTRYSDFDGLLLFKFWYKKKRLDNHSGHECTQIFSEVSQQVLIKFWPTGLHFVLYIYLQFMLNSTKDVDVLHKLNKIQEHFLFIGAVYDVMFWSEELTQKKKGKETPFNCNWDSQSRRYRSFRGQWKDPVDGKGKKRGNRVVCESSNIFVLFTK